ncbi:MAG: hypothetical protein ACNA8L_10270 [Luteolibacter sp.]
MAGQDDIRIDIDTTANTAGAEEAKKAIEDISKSTEKSVESTDKQTTATEKETEATQESTDAIEEKKKAVDELDQSQVRIVDSTRKNTDAVDDQVEALKRWQDELRKARQAQGTSGLASNVVTPEERAEREEAARAEEARLNALAERNQELENEATLNRNIAESVKSKNAAEELLEQQRKQSDVSNDVRQIKRLAFARAMNVIGQATRAAAANLREYAKEIEGLDDDTAEKIEGVAKGFDMVGQSVNAASAGMVIAGPKGAAAAAILAPAWGLFADELDRAVRASAQLKQLENVGATLEQRLQRGFLAKAAQDAEKAWADLRREMEATRKEAESINRIAEAERNLQERRAAQALQRAEARGEGVDAARANLENIQERNLTARQDEEMSMAFRQAEDAMRELSRTLVRNREIEALVKAEKAVTGGTTEEAIARTINISKLEEELKKNEESLADLRAAADDAKRALDEKSRLLSVERELFLDNRENTGALEQIQRTKAAEGGSVDAINEFAEGVEQTGKANRAVRAGVELIKSFAADNELSAEELERLPPILDRINNEVRDTLPEALDLLNNVRSQIDEFKQELKTLKLQSKNVPE